MRARTPSIYSVRLADLPDPPRGAAVEGWRRRPAPRSLWLALSHGAPGSRRDLARTRYREHMFDDAPLALLPLRLGSAEVSYADARSILTPASGFIRRYDYTLNPYSGCGFGCDYCYARYFAPSEEQRDCWGRWVRVKRNVDRRFEALEELTAAGIRVGVAISPMLPVDDIEAFGTRLAALDADGYVTQYFHASTGWSRFAANTTEEAQRNAAEDGWTSAAYRETRDRLAEMLGDHELLEGDQGFAPA